MRLACTFRTVFFWTAIGAFAQSPASFRYFYYDSGQLFRILDSTGTLIEYSVDPTGNITQTNRSSISAGSPAILSIAPFTATVGGTFTIYGQNFSTNPANDIVKINGVTAIILSATSNQLLVQVPVGATAGQVTVTVSGTTVSSGPTVIFTPIAPSVISAISPASAPAGQNVTITVTGTNLNFATFYFATGLNIVTSAQIAANGSSATLQAALSTATGTDNIIAVSYLGTSITGPGNQFTVLAAPVPVSGYVISNPTISALNDISQPGTSLAASPAVSALNFITQPGSNFATEVLSVLNSATSPGGAAAMSRWVSVLNNSSSGNAVSASSSSNSTGSAKGASRPGLSLAGTPGLTTRILQAVPGQTISLEVAGGQTGRPALLLNGAVIDDPATPGTKRFTVPSGVSAVQAVVRDGGEDSDAVEFTVPRPELTTNTPRHLGGRLLLPDGTPAAERRLEVRSTGLTAEYFHWKTALSALPALDRLEPDRVGVVSSLAMENPAAIFGADPFGTGLTPNYVARFTGAIHVDAEGEQRFFLTSHAGSRLLVDGQVVAEVPLSSGPGTATGTAQLTLGWHAIEVDHFESSGSPELRLEWERPGLSRETVDPAHLTPARFWNARTDSKGIFIIPDFPAFLDPLEFRAVCDGQCSIVMEQNQ